MIALIATLPPLFKPNEPIVATKKNDALVVEINPEAVFSLDENGVVLDVVANNADADVILSLPSRVEELEGEPIERSVEIFVDYAAQLGFLDFATPDALRISAVQQTHLERVEDSLKEYFCERGARIAVVFEKLTADSLCERLGVETQSMQALTETLKGVPVLYAGRVANGLQMEDLEKLYRENVSELSIKELYKTELKKKVEKIEKNVAALQALEEKSSEIKGHEDNPLAILGGMDYWTLTAQLEENRGDYTQAFSKLMTEMDGMNAAYEKEYGVVLDSWLSFETELARVRAMPLQGLIDLLAQFAMGNVSTNLESLAQMLEELGVDVSSVSKFSSLPKNKEEYLAKSEEFSRSLFDTLAWENRTGYETVLPRLNESEYDAYIKEIETQYGSLSAYWEKLQKKLKNLQQKEKTACLL